MDPRSNERISTASNDDSILQYVNDRRSGTKKRRRACPILILLALVIHFLAAGCGITISVLVVRFGLETSVAERQDLVSRILLFVSSCVGNVYILMHIFASREKYVRSLQNGSPQIHGYFFAAVSFLIARLSLPVWIATVVMNALVAAMIGFNLQRGVKTNVAWIQLLIATVGLDTIAEMPRESFDRSRINTPESSSGGGSPDGQNTAPSGWTDRSSRVEPRRNTRRDTLRVRSQAVPTPLETIFGSRETLPDPRNSPGIKGDFSWRPPTRDSEYGQRPTTSESFRDTLQPRSNAASTVFSNMSALPHPLATNPVPPSLVPGVARPADQQALRQSVVGPQRSSSVPPVETQTKPPPQRRPTLPNLTDLPARAAARRRNSLMAREADLDPRASREISRRFSIMGQDTIAPPSPRNDFIEVPIPNIKPRDLDTDEDGIIPEDLHPLARNNTTRARLVRNFSRPRRRSTMVGSADEAMDGDKARRTSSYLPEPARERARVAPSDAMRTRRVSLVLDEPRSKPPTARLPMLRKPVGGPRFSPFPAPSGANAPDQRRIKGLGQGSQRRLDKEVARWVEGVQADPRASSDAPPSIISDVSTGTDILDVETTGPSSRRGGGGGKRLSRGDSVSGRTRRIAQNF
ncbi:hypothetical protein KVR01_009453 [Diaporthe batatas]|uniref:uncharacterized protein n=1 Tax=Diaporthe batatas TaxID=748121 RepID=UPI001D04A096|nr:uncharacterized protein KVR01_009453 [Diaporthe batatas]KAG8161189.1 hypothetical protein KVR01_009453 [Diaporthe batatas]